MNRINGRQTSFAPIRDEGSRIVISYGLKELSDDLYEWMEIYLPKKQMSMLTMDMVKEAVLADINERVKNNIISDFVWNGKPVWFNEDNQLNWSQAVVPATFKIGEQEDGTPVYHEFATKSELKSFNDACIAWKQQCLTEGYAEKDGIDWQPYEAFFPKTSGEE